MKTQLRNMKAVILAGGDGSRLDEATRLVPKPLVKIGKDPIILHVMKIYLIAEEYILYLQI